MATNEDILRRFNRFQTLDEEEKQGFVGQMLSDIADVPSRILSMQEYGVRSLTGFDSPEQQELLGKRAIGGALDIATLLIPFGKIAAPIAKPLASSLARTAVRSAAAGLKAAPFFTDRETASDPVARAEGLLTDAALGAAVPVAGKALAPLGRGAQSAISRVASPLSPKAAETAEAVSRKELRQIEMQIKNLAKTRLAGTRVKDLSVDLLPEVTQRSNAALDELIGEMDLAAAATLRDLGSISQGTYSPEVRAGLGSVITSDAPVEVSGQLIAKAQRTAAALKGEWEAILDKVAVEGDESIQPLARAYLSKINSFSDEFRALRSEAGRSLRQLRPAVDQFKSLIESVGGLGEIAERKGIFFNFGENLKEKGLRGALSQAAQRAGATGPKGAINYWVANIFPVYSAVRDVVTNLGAVAGEGAKAFGDDLFDLATKEESGGLGRSAALLSAIRRGGRLPASVAGKLEQTALGEKIPPILSEKIDRFVFAPAQLKRGVDSFFKRLGALSALTEDAVMLAEKEGLSGLAKTERVKEIINSAPDEMVAKAVERAKRFGFNRDLSKFEEQIATNPVIKLLVTPFPRWSFQFTRWLAEFSPMDPAFWKKVTKNEATAQDFAGFLTRNLTGASGVHFVSENLYDNVDFSTMEYVREDGARIKLSGLTPVPDALAIAAWLKGDSANMLNALEASSLPVLGGPGEGILGRLWNVGRDMYTGTINFDSAGREFADFAATLIPGRGMLAAVSQIQDPTMRKGITKDIPFLNQYAEERIDPATGEVLRYSQRLPLLGEFERLPRGFPFAARVTSKVESELFRLGLGVKRPRRLPFLEVEDLGLPDHLQKQYEVSAGQNVSRMLERLIQSSGYGRLDDETKLSLVQRIMSDARGMAKAQIMRDSGLKQSDIRAALNRLVAKQKAQTR